MVPVVPPAEILRISQASLCFAGDRPLFEALSLSLPGRGWTCLMGRSGCGKSSLLRMVAGLPVEVGRQGHAHIERRNGEGGELSVPIAWMPQRDMLMPWRRAVENVAVGAALRGQRWSDARERAEALLERVGLAGLGARWPDSLSGGQRQRVALARTLFEAGGVVLMDEPFSALDALTRLELQDLAAEVLAEQSVLLVTHDPLEALRLADTLYVFGADARLHAMALPPGDPPRTPGDVAVAGVQAALFERLRGTGGERTDA
ncbi:ABC transporter ATP-binding protein [Halotalea alkalilenta]|uniref:ABC transporter ATP-binding protein n=1 Tax=Halotalea alkalilenta TaxID=376489 RepID=UPI000487E72B|nr:ABC transporter ATP-binding protein [Halotalea alkalilenta]